MPELDILENVVEGTSHFGTPFFDLALYGYCVSEGCVIFPSLDIV